ncbi:formyltransferase family protein [Schleiferiaceae bacterium]|nr:formyltransferase family protein [Schleiferiaceae bacterium]
MKIAFAASRKLAIRIIDWICENKAEYNIQIVGGVALDFDNWWEDKVAETYQQRCIPVFSSLEEMINASSPDIVFSLNYWKIIPEEFVAKIPKGIINIHHSYKLRFRGRYSTSWAILHARKDNNWWHGTTLHHIDSKLDNGPIIASERCQIMENDTAETLFERVEDLAVEMFMENFGDMLNGVESFIEPDEDFFYYGKNSKKNLRFDGDMSFDELYDFVRAWTFRNRPGPFIENRGRIIELSLGKK